LEPWIVFRIEFLLQIEYCRVWQLLMCNLSLPCVNL
jgi:hypothetical protein